jgi:glycosyltransferase involved in cell wall biosynthesis
MPTFNSASYLKSTVDSVRAQTLDCWELILSDDGSSDDTLAITNELVQSDPRITSVKGAHGGPAVTRQRGLRCSDSGSEFVIFMDSDDTWETDTLSVLVQALQSRPDSPAAYGLARGTDMDGNQLENDDLADSMRRRDVLRDGQYVELAAGAGTPFEAMLHKNCPVTPGTALIRRSALDAIGDFDPSTAPADDWDLFLRLARKGDLNLVDCVLLNWRRHPDSLANTSKRWSWAYLVVRVRTIQCGDNSPQQRGAALEALRMDCHRSRREALAGLQQTGLRDAARATVYGIASHAMYARLKWFGGSRRSAQPFMPAVGVGRN